MDIGTTAHLHSEEGILKTKSNSIFYPSIFVGDSSKIVVCNMGYTNLSYSNPYRTLSLKNVLITPNIIKNLIYVRHFTADNQCSIEFDPFGFSVKDLQTKHTLLRCDSSGDLYPVTTPAPHMFVSTSSALWHQRHGHLSLPVFQHLVS